MEVEMKSCREERGRVPDSLLPSSSVLFLLAWGLVSGCDSRAGSPPSEVVEAPAPVHPALRDVPRSRPSADPHSGMGESGALPAGHPPISSSDPAPSGTGSGAAPPSPVASSPPPPPEAKDAAPSADAGVAVKLRGLGLAIRVPAGWREEPPASTFRLGTFRLPGSVEGNDIEMSVSPAGGGVEANIERWRGQFEERPEPRISRREVGGVSVTLAELDGTFLSMGGAAGSGPPRPGTRLWGAVVKLPEGNELIFFKAWGPSAAFETWKASLDEFVGSFALSGR